MSATEAPLHVCFLWHMHQPPYADPVTGEVLLPWVRLHGLKDYGDVPLALTETPGARATINWVPGLLDQLDAAAAEDAWKQEQFWRLATCPPADLSGEERATIRRDFFSLDHTHMLDPYPRYREVYALARSPDRLSEPDLRDLQVWFTLAWCGSAARRHPTVADLLERGRDFTEEDKRALNEAQREILSQVTERCRDLVGGGRLEVCCSPYYHPILPLLADTDVARVADESSPAPRQGFRWPGDARAQLSRGRDAHTARFGEAPAGCWPSEGSLSPEIVEMAAELEFRWLVTDQALLERSLGRAPTAQELLAPWDLGGVAGFFREHELSDRIGFVYATWEATDAWSDFAERLTALRQQLDGRPGVVTIALDGENCWETYDGGAMAFLPGLYRAIAATPGLQLSTLSEALDEVGTGDRRIDELAPGSWINGTFRTWLGDPSKNRGWDLLASAREVAGGDLSQLMADDPALADLIMRAEASDWWWWLGEGHSSPYDPVFDRLLRRHLTAIYRHLDREVPPALLRPITAMDGGGPVTAPTRTLEPPLTGRVRSFYSWYGAGSLTPAFGATHRADWRLRRVRFVASDEELTVRIECASAARRAVNGRHLVLIRHDGEQVALWPPEPGVVAVCDQVLDARIPLTRAGADAHDRLVFSIALLDADSGEVIERLPPTGAADVRLEPPAPGHAPPSLTADLRRDAFEHAWVVVAPERGNRPSYTHNASCPFCDMDDHSHHVLLRIDGPDGPVRVVPNAFPALRVEASLAPERLPGRHERMGGLGAHEIVIETPLHDRDLGQLQTGQIATVLRVWRERIRDLHRDVRLGFVFPFRNHGPGAGASVEHPHSQIIATPVPPPRLERELSQISDHFTRTGRPLLGDVLEAELASQSRIVRADDHLVSWCDFASRQPFEIVVAPRLQQHDFTSASDTDVDRLAEHLDDVLRRLRIATDGADWNMALSTAPNPAVLPLAGLGPDTMPLAFRWHLRIIVRRTHPGGFEWATGMYINPTPPELAAAHLRKLG